jgi:integrase
MEAKDIYESAQRARSLVGRVMRYAIATGRAERDIIEDLRGALTTPKTKKFAAIVEPRRIGKLLRAIDDYQGQPATAFALKLAPIVFVRPDELRGAAWSEFMLDGKEPKWRIAASRMKMGEQHIVPLSRQAVLLLRNLHNITGSGRFLFPSLLTNTRCMSNNTVNAALRRLGFSSEEMVGHGFRAMASTCLNERGWHPDVIELQLARKERNKVAQHTTAHSVCKSVVR